VGTDCSGSPGTAILIDAAAKSDKIVVNNNKIFSIVMRKTTKSTKHLETD
jgi:hypothetical protein